MPAVSQHRHLELQAAKNCLQFIRETSNFVAWSLLHQKGRLYVLLLLWETYAVMLNVESDQPTVLKINECFPSQKKKKRFDLLTPSMGNFDLPGKFFEMF